MADDVDRETIAQKLGIKVKTLDAWANRSEFKDEVEALQRADMRVLDYRLGILNDIAKRIRGTIKARAEDMADIPGGKYGLLVRRIKMIGSGENAEKVEEYLYDRGPVEDLMEVAKNIAQHQGQWTEKRELTGASGTPLLDPLVAALEKAYGNRKQ